jgi:hypothetical protein
VIVMDLIPVQADVVEFVKEGVAGFILKTQPSRILWDHTIGG